MRAVVVGGSGQIGGWLLRVLRERGHAAVGTFATKPFPGLAPLNAADEPRASAWLIAQRPEVVFYPAGFTWVDECERNPALAFAANVDQPLTLARTAASIGARFVYFSTDYVFDGAAGPYDESSPTNPLSVYGQAKLDAEQRLGSEQLIVRTTWVYGPEQQGKNFAYQLARSTSLGTPLICPDDQISTPSYGPDVARAAVVLAELGRTGTYHVAGRELLSRLDFGRALAAGLGLNAQEVVGKPTAELGQVAPRPLKSGLRTPKLDEDAALRSVMRPLQECLTHFQRTLAEPGICPLAQPVP